MHAGVCRGGCWGKNPPFRAFTDANPPITKEAGAMETGRHWGMGPGIGIWGPGMVCIGPVMAGIGPCMVGVGPGIGPTT